MTEERELLLRELMQEGYLKTPRLIEAFRAIDRADFVLPEYRGQAYGNYPLPIGYGQTISQPLTVALMLELLKVGERDTVLDIGAGSGWQTALLAKTVGPEGKVVAVERIPELCDFAKTNLEKYGFLADGRATFLCQDAASELPDGPYDKVIAAAAASKEIPPLWRRAVKVGGRIVAPVEGSVWLFIKRAEDQWEEREFPGFAFVPLVHDERKTTNVKRKTKKAARLVPLLLLTFAFSLSTLFMFETYLPHTRFNGTKTVVIERGLGSRKIAALLKREGVIRSKWVFVVYVSARGKASSLKPGEYTFGRVAIPEIVETLIKGGVNERAIVIPEGWNTNEIADYLDAQKLFSEREFIRFVGTPYAPKTEGRFIFLADKPRDAGLEGYLFPDTYRIDRDASPEDVAIKMLENFDKKLAADFREEIKKQGKTIFEIITMASLIEKEVASEEDRKIVSGILWKRLAAGIPLQVDATITYLTGKKSTRVSRDETRIPSPHNTYLNRGLPKGPIANPGLSAIHAALFPQQSPYLYYLSAPDGRTIFSKTLEEHNAAKLKYLK